MEWAPIWVSAKTAVVSVIITFIIGTLVAYLAVRMRSERGKALLDGILTLPMVLPPTVVGFFLLLIFGQKRPVGMFLSSIGIRIVFNWWATVIAAFVISFPLMYRSARGAFEQVDENLVHAARTLGLGEWEIFRKVVLPEAAPGVLSGGVLAFARGLGEFGATAMIAGNISGKTRTLPLAIYSAVAGGNMQDAYGYVAILIVLSFLVILLMNYFGSGARREKRGGRRSEGREEA